jgi:hypothetical protein
VFDATYYRPKDFKVLMKDFGYTVAVGVTPCPKGHTLRDRHNHCLQCSTASLGFAARHHEPGYVYVAYSHEEYLVKVGASQDPEARVSDMNRHGYGSVWDWELWSRCYSADSGAVEARVHRALRDSLSPRSYTWAGKLTTCYEVFGCGPDEAEDAIREAASGV